jgi:outer membrane protein assembly factor BamB
VGASFSEEQQLMRKGVFLLAVFLGLIDFASAQGPRRIALGDWPELRGPERNGSSGEKSLIERWSLEGENLLWRIPYGGRSTPVVMGNRVYLQNPSGRGAALQERVMAVNADTGSVLWEYKFNIFQSDIPAHRVGWASPAVDPETGNVYALSGGAQVIALNSDGKLLWERAFGEEYAAFTTHGGRTMSPVIDGDLVIVSAAISSWGDSAARAHRFIALDKRTGDIVYVANPGGRPYDTAYASPLIATINGVRLLIAGLGDGAVHAIHPQTGKKVWSFVASKRAINTGVVVQGNTVILSHGDENLDTNVMGMMAAVDGSQAGDIKATRWAAKGTEFGYSAPVSDGTRVYQIDNGSRLKAFEIATGRELWSLALGRVQKASPVLADGKIYVGSEDGRFFIVRPHDDRGEILSDVELPVSVQSCCGSEGTPEQILGGAAVSRGRIFFMSSDAVYALGPRQAKSLSGWAVDEPAARGTGAPARVQVVPTEVVLTAGQTLRFRARLFDDKGQFLREETASWSLEGLNGTVNNGAFTVSSQPALQAGLVKATVGGLTGTARARVVHPLPWTETFESYADGELPPGWVNAAASRLRVATVDGQKVLQKPPDNTIFKRGRVFIGPSGWSNYTFEAEGRASEQRRQLGSIGITAQRYTLVLHGNAQQLKLEPWQPEVTRTVSTRFPWKADTWYHMKLRVTNLPNGQVRVQGKAWERGMPEPESWTIEHIDPIGNRAGAPGPFLDAEYGALMDNFALTTNP